MKLHNSGSEIFVPDNVPAAAALSRTTHLAIGAHQDDIELMAFHGILECYTANQRSFLAVTATNGSGSPRTGPYGGFSDEEMQAVRKEEQRQAARLGRYSAMIQLNYPSAELKKPHNPAVAADLLTILKAARPKTVYTHNLADKHETHVAIATAAIEAMRALPAGERPSKIYGCEVWRDLDWLPDEEKAALKVSGRNHLAAALLGLYDSQIAGGKRYDLAALGRRRANATFFESHGVDEADEISFAMDLTPLVTDPGADMADYVGGCIDRFRTDVVAKIRRMGGG